MEANFILKQPTLAVMVPYRAYCEKIRIEGIEVLQTTKYKINSEKYLRKAIGKLYCYQNHDKDNKIVVDVQKGKHKIVIYKNNARIETIAITNYTSTAMAILAGLEIMGETTNTVDVITNDWQWYDQIKWKRIVKGEELIIYRMIILSEINLIIQAEIIQEEQTLITRSIQTGERRKETIRRMKNNQFYSLMKTHQDRQWRDIRLRATCFGEEISNDRIKNEVTERIKKDIWMRIKE